MRHAFDADHIAAIDNTTRKLVARASARCRSGSSSRSGTPRVVFVLAVLLNFGIRALDSRSGTDNSGLHTSPAWSGPACPVRSCS
jgi:high-affinity nickel-transport protein